MMKLCSNSEQKRNRALFHVRWQEGAYGEQVRTIEVYTAEYQGCTDMSLILEQV